MQRKPLDAFFERYEQGWRFLKIFPHIEFVGRPLYKLLGGNKRPLLSVPTTFFLMDIMFHQLLMYIAADYERGRLSAKTMMHVSLFRAFVFTSLSIPLAYYKFQKNKQAHDKDLQQEPMNENKKSAVTENKDSKDALAAVPKQEEKAFFADEQKQPKKRKRHKKRKDEISDAAMARSVFAKKS